MKIRKERKAVKNGYEYLDIRLFVYNGLLFGDLCYRTRPLNSSHILISGTSLAQIEGHGWKAVKLKKNRLVMRRKA